MDWKKAAEKINGEYHSNRSHFIGGDTLIKRLLKESELGKFVAEKKIIRSFGSSSHHNAEKIECKFLFNDHNFEKFRIVRKPFLKRLGKSPESCFDIDGNYSETVKGLILIEELSYLLDYPKSEVFIIANSINFRAECLGQMKEDVVRIYEAIENIKDELIKGKAS